MEPNAVTVEDTAPSRALAVAQKDDAPECSAFECNICYDVAESPVVTMCGHLYCWPCLYRCVLSLPAVFSLTATSPGLVRCLARTPHQPLTISCCVDGCKYKLTARSARCAKRGSSKAR